MNPAANIGLVIKINARISPSIPSASVHPHPFTPERCNSMDAPIPQMDWNITQNPTKNSNTAIVSIGATSSIIPNRISIIPLARVHPQPLSISLLDTAKIIENIPLTKNPATNRAANTPSVVPGFARHHTPRITAITPTTTEIHQYLTAFFTEDKK